ncbi:MAG TPA: prepilin-type N-terminal cleavage/methylation domain-containing protein [Candidatus Cybelea sp.]|jgi:prepilin-type N-terminal cleavage/methylation domain-containing protein|nr:prepilin-type N-terminal cleavage/methylation domain-containing protein [Candidatus Cybelea sp.]
MELRKKIKFARQSGMSLIELMIASLILTVGVLGTAVLIPIAIGTNGKNRQQSNSTVIAQMTMEKITSSAAAGSSALTLTDCAGTSNTISVTGTTSGSGATVLSSGSIDFSQAQGSTGAPAGYYMSYVSCGTSGRTSTYDVRWNIQTPSNYVKLVTVSAQLKGSGSNQVLFSLPVTIRSMVGGN